MIPPPPWGIFKNPRPEWGLAWCLGQNTLAWVCVSARSTFRIAFPRTANVPSPALQTHLMDVAAEAQTLAAASNHSAFNVANALGPWLGGMAVSAGLGWSSTGLVGAATALTGFAVFVIAYRHHNLVPAMAEVETER